MQRIARTVIAAVALGALVAPTPAPAADGRRVSAWLPYWDSTALASFTSNSGLFDQLLPFWYEMRSTDSVVGYPGAGSKSVVDAARNAGVALLPTVTNDFDSARVHSMLATDASIDAHVEVLTRIAATYDGIDVDYEGLLAGDRARFTIFIQRLASSVHAAGKKLSVTVHPKTAEPGSWDGPMAQNWAAIGAVSDRVRIMAYDFSWSSSPAGPVAPLAWVDAVAAFAASQMPAAKVNLGMPLYGYDWVGSNGTGVTWSQAEERRTSSGAVLRRSSDGSEPWFTYRASGVDRTVWYSDATSTGAKLGVVDKYGLSGLTFWRLGGEDPSVWNSVRAWNPGPTDPPTDSTPPTKVRGPKVRGKQAQVAVRWGPSTDENSIRYRILRTGRRDGKLKKVGVVASRSFRDSKVKRGRLYWYAVRPVDAAGNVGALSRRVPARPL